MSEKIGKGSTYINQVENKGSWPSPEMVDKIANVLEIRAAILFDESQCPKNLVAAKHTEFVKEVSDTLHEKITVVISNTLNTIINHS